jgi:hypothetical protein
MPRPRASFARKRRSASEKRLGSASRSNVFLSNGTADDFPCPDCDVLAMLSASTTPLRSPGLRPLQRSRQSLRRSFYFGVRAVGESEGEAVAVRTFDTEARERDEALPLERPR